MTQVRLALLQIRTPEPEASERLTPAALSGYVRQLQSATAACFELAVAPANVRVSVEVKPGPTVEMSLASQPGLSEPVMQRLHDALIGVSTPAVASGPLTFHFDLEIRV
jgi:hypothetical protein